VEPAQVGQALLWGAVILAFAAGTLPWVGTRFRLRGAAILAFFATAVLLYSLLTHDFALEYVVRTTSRATPWPYRLSALWGGMEGSLLFYSAMLLGVGAYGLRHAGNVENRIVAFVGAGLLLLTAMASNPFTRLDIPAVDGRGLLAILQHPAMVYHPPILYLGLTALVVPFAIVIGAIVRGETDSRGWLVPVRRTLLFPWTMLTLGMVAGANWAYVELGWGGFWAWDPVENTALMPWLAATVFFHTQRVTTRDGRLRRWTVFFAALPFALSVPWVYLTRSGATGSIHSFAEDPLVGRILLGAALVVGVAVTWTTWRLEKGTPWDEFGLGRDTWLGTSAVLVGVILVFVLVGSAYPAYVSVFTGDTMVLDSRYFVTTVLTPSLVIALVIGFALQTNWKRPGIKGSDLVALTVGAAGAMALMWAVLEDARPAGLALAVVSGGAFGMMVWNLDRRRLVEPARLAHLGLVMVLVGAGGSALGADVTARMRVGESLEVGSHTIELVSVSTGEAYRYVFAEGRFLVDGRVELAPQIRGYEDQTLPVAEPALWSTPRGDVIVAVSMLTPEVDGFDVAVFVRPMVWWVWAGAVVVTLAGLVALRAPAGVAAARRRSATAGLPPAGTTT
jgi:cytochrome c-type biogenesis protein CcmF